LKKLRLARTLNPSNVAVISSGLFDDGILCYHLLTLTLFQTCMTFFLLWNTKEDILKDVFVHTLKVSEV